MSSPTISALIIPMLMVAAIVLFGATLFAQGVTNGISNGANYSNVPYVLTNQTQQFNSVMANFTSSFANSTQAATATPASFNPFDAFNFAIGNGLKIVGLVFPILGIGISMLSAGIAAISQFVPGWFIALAITWLALLVLFGTLAYVIRWFT